VDLETALTSLYAAPREEFIPSRADLVKQARAAGDRELASKIGAVRKPTVAAWLLNQVSREYPDDLDTLAELGEALRDAHQQLAADKLRTLSQQRNEVLRTLDDRALRIARRATMPVTAAVTEALREAFTAALLDPDVLATLRTGRLPAVPGAEASTGWPSWDGIPATAPKPSPKSSPKPAKSTKDDESVRREAEERREARRAAAEARRADAQEQATRAETARAEAEQALTAAKQRVDEADAELVAARNRVEQARFEQRSAKQAALAAQHDYDQADRNSRAARRTLTDLG
jgi:hypothetical protein